MIIGLGYRKQSGKDTVANYLVANYNFTKMSFARPLKDACIAAFGFTEEQVNGPLKEVEDHRWGMTPRAALQHVGTEMFRGWREDFWVNRLVSSLQPLTVITDVRFPNEAAAVKEAGGRLWLIDRPSLGPVTDGHASETSMQGYDGWDAILDNITTLEHLYRQVDRLMEGHDEL